MLAAEPHSKLDVNAEKEIHIFILTSQLCRATGRVLKKISFDAEWFDSEPVATRTHFGLPLQPYQRGCHQGDSSFNDNIYWMCPQASSCQH